VRGAGRLARRAAGGPLIPTLFAGALAVRLVAIAVLWDDYVPDSDAFSYQVLAERLRGGHGFQVLTPELQYIDSALRPPAYPVLLAAVGASVGAGQLLNAVLGSAVVVLAAVLARRLGGVVAGWAAGVAVALHPALLANDVVLLSEPLGLLAVLAVVLLLLDDRPVLAGLAGGVLVLTRPPGPIMVAVALVWLLRRRGWRPALAGGAVAVALVVPWLAHNQARFGSPVLTTTVGFNLAAAYAPAAQEAGRFTTPPFDLSLDEVEQDDAHRELALDNLRDDPTQVVEVATRNAVDLLELTPSDNEIAERIDGRSMGLRRWTLPVVWAVLVAGGVGLWRARRVVGVGLSAAVVAAAVVPSVLTVAAPRLRAPLDLACCVGVGLLVGSVAGRRASPTP
jgi:hypothetical protein